MNCPRCGHPASEHTTPRKNTPTWRNEWWGGCKHSDSFKIISKTQLKTCDCTLSEAQATRLAQRRKAGERMAEVIGETREHSEKKQIIYIYSLALRDTGILAPGETEQDLLKELEGESK